LLKDLGGHDAAEHLAAHDRIVCLVLNIKIANLLAGRALAAKDGGPALTAAAARSTRVAG
jgi:hypothetical protein